MKPSILAKWLYLIAGCGILFQPTTGCPTDAMIRGVFSSSLQSLFNDIFGLYTEAFADSLFDV